MRVIPVIDLMDGMVVRAQRGDRASYRPIVTPLAGGSDPIDLARALLARCPPPAGEPPVLYVADLDALTGRPMQIEAVARLLDALPSVALWLDAGFRGPAHAAQVCAELEAPRPAQISGAPRQPRVAPVIASESLADVHALDTLATDEHAILSLDSRLSTPMDPAGVWQRPDLWPATVIVMTLDRVGAEAGPDVAALAALAARAPHVRRWVGAGGLRDAADLAAAAQAGAHAWLVASALHDGRLDPRTTAPGAAR